MYSLSVILLWTIPYIFTYHYLWNTESLIVVVAFTSNLLLSGIFKKSIPSDILCPPPSQYFLVLRWIWIHYELDILTIISCTAKVEQSYIFFTLHNKIRISHNYIVFYILHVCVIFMTCTMCLNVSYQFLYVMGTWDFY